MKMIMRFQFLCQHAELWLAVAASSKQSTLACGTAAVEQQPQLHSHNCIPDALYANWTGEDDNVMEDQHTQS